MLTYKPKKLGHKVIALMRAFRGCALLIVGVSLWRIVSIDALQDIKNRIEDFNKHVDEPIINWLLNYVSKTNEEQVIFFALLVTIFSVIRLIEATGVWFAKRWGETISFIGCLIYIPIMIVALTYEFNVWILGLIILNCCIASYLFLALKETSLTSSTKRNR